MSTLILITLDMHTFKDPTQDSSYLQFLQIAKDNTKIYEEVFPNIPQNTTTTFDQYEYWKQAVPIKPERLQNIRYFLVG